MKVISFVSQLKNALLLTMCSSTLCNAAEWIDTDITDVKNKLNHVHSVSDQVNNRTATILSNLNQTGLDVEEIVSRTLSGAEVLGPRVTEEVQYVIGNLSSILENSSQANKLSQFLGDGNECDVNSECYQFKQDLIQFLLLLNELGMSSSEVYGNSLAARELNFVEVINLIHWIPPKALFPLYLISSELINEDSNRTLIEAIESVRFLKELVLSDEQGRSLEFDSIVDGSYQTDGTSFQTVTCNILKVPENKRRAKSASLVIAGAGAAAKVVGGLLKLIGHSYVAGPTAKDAGIHGYVHMQVENNWLKMLGVGATEIGDVIVSGAEFLFNKQNFCKLLITQEEIILELRDESKLVEEALRTCRPTVPMIIPEGKGGIFNVALDVTANRISEMRELYIDTSKAERFLSKAENQSARGEFGKSFKTLCKSYRSLVAADSDDDD